MEATAHRPVLLREALAALAVRPGGFWVDGTVGAGGHAEAILRATSPDGRLLACDRDAESLQTARARLAPFEERVVLRHADYRRLPELLDEVGVPAVAGILLDLGISSLQLDDAERGFSFRKDGPLDMRIDRTQPATAADLVNSLAEERLAAILKEYGEEKAAGRIARAVGRERAKAPITSTRRLAEIVAATVPGRGPSRIHPATRTFQALRIATNREIEGLDSLIETAAGRLQPGGRIAVIAFHSLEDRIVKKSLRGLTRRCVCPRDLPICVCGRPGLVRMITGKAVRPSAEEARVNPRSRSARLRAAERLESAA
jgi:16S rRNA (cytosine1402-N4)-methyltransferase